MCISRHAETFAIWQLGLLASPQKTVPHSTSKRRAYSTAATLHDIEPAADGVKEVPQTSKGLMRQGSGFSLRDWSPRDILAALRQHGQVQEWRLEGGDGIRGFFGRVGLSRHQDGCVRMGPRQGMELIKRLGVIYYNEKP